MKFYKIFALMYADWVLVKNSKWRLIEYFYFPITTILIYGLFALFVQSYAAEAGLIVLIVNIIWNFAQVAQTHVNQSLNEDSWSGSLKQIIITGVSDMEYVIARVLSSIIISIFVLILILGIAVFAFNLSILVTQWPIFLPLMAATLIASLGLAIIVVATMIALGREYSFLAWSAMSIFILLSAPFYPVNLLPEHLQPIATFMPYTNIFEATRAAVTSGPVSSLITNSLYVAIGYFIISLPIYKFVFIQARKKGWIVRLS